MCGKRRKSLLSIAEEEPALEDTSKLRELVEKARNTTSLSTRRALLQTPGPSGAPGDDDDGPRKKFGNKKKALCGLIGIGMDLMDLMNTLPGVANGETGQSGNAPPAV